MKPVSPGRSCLMCELENTATPQSPAPHPAPLLLAGEAGSARASSIPGRACVASTGLHGLPAMPVGVSHHDGLRIPSVHGSSWEGLPGSVQVWPDQEGPGQGTHLVLGRW